MYINRNRYYIQILLHVLIWSLLAFIMFMYPPFATKRTQLPTDFIIKQVVHMVVMLVAYYFNAYVLVPRYLLKSKHFQFVLSIIIFICIASFFMALVDRWLDLPVKMQHIRTKTMWANPYLDMFALWTTLFTLGISTSISVINKWNKDNKERIDFEQEKTKAELSFLKAQIHPHFFFNTMNSIYALSYVDIEASRKVLTKLSRMMRYLLYETEQDKTSLSKELAFIKDYVNIMKLRVNTNTRVEFSIPDEVLPMSIAPMILMPFVENTFKHGIDDANEGTISILLKQDTQGIVLTTRNKIVKTANEIEKDGIKGIGIQNTRRRLDLIYSGCYELSTNIDAVTNEFELKLILHL